MDRKELLNSPTESFRSAFEGEKKQLWTALPAIVTAVDFERQTISAQSAISGEVKDAQGNVTPINMPVFEDVVLCLPRAGGYIITFPVAVGDEVLIFFASRCIDSWWQSGGENNITPDKRTHDLSDSFAILAPTSQPKAVANISPNTMRIMSEDSARYFEITNTDINIVGDNDININTVNNISMTAKNLNFTSGVDISLTAENRLKLKAAEIELDADEEVTITSTMNVIFNIAEDLTFDAKNIIFNASNQFNVTSESVTYTVAQNMVLNITGSLNITAENVTYNVSQEIDVTAGTLIDLHVPTINLNGATVNP